MSPSGKVNAGFEDNEGLTLSDKDGKENISGGGNGCISSDEFGETTLGNQKAQNSQPR